MAFFLGRGPYAASRNCYMGQDLATPVFDYAVKFFRKYKRERKFFTVRLIDPHEFSGVLSSFIDPVISDFLERMDTEGHLENTIV